MNYKFLFIYLVSFEFTAYAQNTPDKFLQSVPPAPGNICNISLKEKKACLQKFDLVEKQIEAEIDKRNKQATANEKKNAEAIKAGALKKAGFDEATATQMQNATPEQRKAMADKMMQQQYNMSMADAQKLKNMTKEQREAWAASQGTKIAADAQANPGKYKTHNYNSSEMIEVSRQIQELNKKFKLKDTEFQQRIDALKSNPDAIKRRAEIDGLKKKLANMGGEVSETEAKRMDAMAAQIKMLKNQYCAKFSPQYLLIVNDYLTYTKNTMSDYYTYEKLINKQFQLQTGTDSPMGEEGVTGLEYVKRYIDIATGTFEFDLRSNSEME